MMMQCWLCSFNDLSYSSNAYMQALSVLSVIFLPLTFLSGYFGELDATDTCTSTSRY